MKYIIKFSKRGRMAFISHLDMQKLFLRTLRVLGLRPNYSQGYNPHPKMSIALPLSLGFSSSCEYLEFETDAIIEKNDAKNQLNSILPEGIEVIDFSEKDPLQKKSLASLVSSVRYEIIMPMPEIILNETNEIAQKFTDINPFEKRAKIVKLREESISEAISKFQSQDSVFIEKYNKKKDRVDQIDILPNIAFLELTNLWAKQAMYDCILSSVGGRSINPLKMMDAFYAYTNSPLNSSVAKVLRTEIIFN